MIKFETINGTLCLMVEPTPLQLDSPMPCVVRYIQDCSPMGRYLKRKYAMVINTVVIVSRIGIDGRAYSSDKIFVEEVEVLEIIGYPVVDGSAEWALWQMEQGKKVCHKSYTMKTTHCAINDAGQVVIFTTPYSVANGGDVVCHADEWLDHRQYGCGVDERTGWQLYEPQPKPKPKPLLADAQVGWLCKLRNGEWRQIKGFGDSWGTNDCLNPNLFTVFLTDGTTRNIYGTYLGTTANPLPNDIIATEPIASEGSAEWAWQMLKLGKPVTNKWVFTAGGHIKDTDSDKYQFVQLWDFFSDWQLYKEPKPEPAKEPEIVAHKQQANCLVCGKVIEGLLDGHATVSIKRYSISTLYESTYSHYCGKCFLELGFDKTERELRNRQQPIAEPEPEPKFAVGDWVEFRDIEGIKHGIIEGRREEYSVLCNGISQSVGDKFITRKLDPSEVIVNIGCLKGTVTYAVSNDCFLLAKVHDPQHRACCIDMSMLDTATREMVESLLKAQGGAE